MNSRTGLWDAYKSMTLNNDVYFFSIGRKKTLGVAFCLDALFMVQTNKSGKQSDNRLKDQIARVIISSITEQVVVMKLFSFAGYVEKWILHLKLLNEYTADYYHHHCIHSLIYIYIYIYSSMNPRHLYILQRIVNYTKGTDCLPRPLPNVMKFKQTSFVLCRSLY